MSEILNDNYFFIKDTKSDNDNEAILIEYYEQLPFPINEFCLNRIS